MTTCTGIPWECECALCRATMRDDNFVDKPLEDGDLDPHWDFVVLYWDDLQGLAAQMSTTYREELFADCVIGRVERVLNTYDDAHPSGASLKSHAFRAFRWYMYKWLDSRGRSYSERNQVNVTHLPEKEYIQTFDLDTVDEVQQILAGIDPAEATLLRLKHVNMLTFQQIADKLGVSKGTARTYYLDALHSAKCFAAAMTR